MPNYVLSERNYRQLAELIKKDRQRLTNLEKRTAGARKNYGGPRSGSMGIRFGNNNGGTVPAYGVMTITGADTNGGYLICDQQGSAYTGLWLVNGPKPVGSGKFGRGRFLTGDDTALRHRFALYNTASTPATGQSWGVVSGSWYLQQHGPGFGILGAANSIKAIVAVIQIPPAEILVKNVGSAIAAAASGSVQVWGGVAGSEANSGLTVTAYNRTSVSLANSKFGAVGIINGQAYLVPLQT